MSKKAETKKEKIDSKAPSAKADSDKKEMTSAQKDAQAKRSKKFYEENKEPAKAKPEDDADAIRAKIKEIEGQLRQLKAILAKARGGAA